MLICILCGKIITTINPNRIRYAVCSSCDVMRLTEKQKQIIKNNK